MRSPWLWLILLLQIVGLAIFAKGFFALNKPVLAGSAVAQYDGLHAPFQRIVLIVIDAFRSDLAYADEAQMPYLHSLIDSRDVLAFTARASTPTVTLPRLKCLVTGGISSFLDAVLNIAESDTSASSALQDNWVSQLWAAGRRIHMYGDDTWLRMFPGVFAQTDGTSSFYVNDFTEVDHNVTRHLEQELRLDAKWDGLILHYLGMDHIGHLAGPKSPHMPAKQREMDDVVRRVHLASQARDRKDQKRTLLVVTGDHGMTEQGNHGGSTDGEVMTAAFMLGHGLRESKDEKSNVGKQDGLVYHNPILQSDIVPAISALLGLPIPLNSVGVVPIAVLNKLDPKYADQVLKGNRLQLESLAKQAGTPQELQQVLLGSSGDFRLELLVVGIAIQAIGAAIAASRWVKARGSLLMLGLPLLWGATTFASSFIEEEHSFWYYLVNIALVIEISKSGVTSRRALTFVAFFVIRHLHQTGDKYAHHADLAGLLSLPTVRALAILSFAAILSLVLTSSPGVSLARRVPVLLALQCVAIFKRGTGSHQIARLVWALITVSLLPGLGPHLPLTTVFSVIWLLQTRQVDWLLLPLMHTMDVSTDLAFAALVQASFFSMGNGNSLARLDLSQAYNGVLRYSPTVVGMLLFVSTFASPIFWAIRWRNARPQTYRLCALLQSTVYTTFLCAACTVLRHHLFVFSVFSPKVLYAVAWAVFYGLVAVT
ncbi:major facilitator super transporter protein [Savitreella phatthalungensis]